MERSSFKKMATGSMKRMATRINNMDIEQNRADVQNVILIFLNGDRKHMRLGHEEPPV
jgi:hypothetical protein